RRLSISEEALTIIRRVIVFVVHELLYRTDVCSEVCAMCHIPYKVIGRLLSQKKFRSLWQYAKPTGYEGFLLLFRVSPLELVRGTVTAVSGSCRTTKLTFKGIQDLILC
ncbi:hypothetical protein Tco_1422168, partial [Tanacetum coccineum]